MDKDVRLLLETVRRYSPSMHEEKLSGYLRKQMTSLGFKNVRTDAAGNAIGEVGRGTPHLLLCGHMDTIPGPLRVRLEDGRVYGRGAVDAKSPMCAMILAAASHPELHVTVACVTREEGDSLGVNTLIDEGGDYDAAVFGEPGGAARLAVGSRGRLETSFTVNTSGGHAGSSWAHDSAVDHALAIVRAMQEYQRRKSPDGDHYHSLDISLTMIDGGSYSNVIPSRCKVTLDVRIPPGTPSASVRSDLTGIAERYAEKNSAAEVKLAFEEPTEAYEATTDSVVVRAFQRSILTNLRTRPTFTHKTGTGDMNTMAERMGVPCVTYGPGDSKFEHTDQEYVDVTDYRNSVQVLRGVFKEFRSLASRREIPAATQKRR